MTPLATSRATIARHAAALPVSRRPADIRARVEALEAVMERAIKLPGGRHVGLDAIIGFIPGVGDIATGCIAAYLVWEARNLGLPRRTLLRMAANAAFDTALGAVPIAGDIFDFFFRSNSRNLKLIKRHLDRLHPPIAA